MSSLAFLMVAEKSTALASYISLCSLKKFCDPTQYYHIHALSVALTLEQEKALEELSEANFQVQVYSVDSEQGATHPQDVAGILRLQLANIFWEIDVALYLDCYSLVQGDVRKFFSLALDAQYGALPMVNDTYCSKVMLLHLKAMREAKVVAELMACNVVKGDFAGYGQALEKVLGACALPLGAEYASHACASLHKEACIAMLSEQNVLWQEYATKVQEQYPTQYALFA